MKQKFIPFDKLSKKERRKQNRQKRKNWNGISPLTRKPENPKAYNRQKARKINNDFTGFYFMRYSDFIFLFSLKTNSSFSKAQV